MQCIIAMTSQSASDDVGYRGGPTATETRATIDDVLRLASHGKRYELVDGKLVSMAPNGFEHGGIEVHISWLLNNYVREHRLGRIVSGEVLFQLDSEGLLARAADVAFVRRERLPARDAEHRPFVGAPDLAIEIISPGDAAETKPPFCTTTTRSISIPRCQGSGAGPETSSRRTSR